jgi:GT2 family glycosyltransferase
MISQTSRDKISKVSIIVLNWNGCNDTLECLDSIANINYENFEVIVVDNGSTDNSVKQIEEKFSSVTLLQTHKNLGYAGGNNVGIQHALNTAAEYVLILNNDTIVDPEILSSFIEVAKILPEAAIFGAKNYYYSDPYKIWSYGALWSGEINDFVLLGNGVVDNEGNFEAVSEIEIAVGSSIFASAKALRTIGLFDERFFLLHEESDLSFRAKESGYKVICVPKAKVWHKVSRSFGSPKSCLMSYFNRRNVLLWAEKHLTLLEVLRMLYRSLTRLYFNCLQVFPNWNLNREPNVTLLKRVFWSCLTYHKGFLRRWHDQRDILLPEFLGIRDYIFRRFGECPRSIERFRVSKSRDTFV